LAEDGKSPLMPGLIRYFCCFSLSTAAAGKNILHSIERSSPPKHLIRTNHTQVKLDSIGISILDTDYTDGHGLGSEIRVRDFFKLARKALCSTCPFGMLSAKLKIEVGNKLEKSWKKRKRVTAENL